MSETTVHSATGRRKEATAHVDLAPGSGEIKVNGRDFDDYFDTGSLRETALASLTLLNLQKEFDVKIQARGGGLSGQAGAVRLAIARALVQLNPDHRAPLKAKGFLTRDPRAKERKKPGRPGARKRFQFSKR